MITFDLLVSFLFADVPNLVCMDCFALLLWFCLLSTSGLASFGFVLRACLSVAGRVPMTKL